MSFLRKRQGNRAWLASALVLFAVLLLTVAMTVGVSAEDTEKYSLNIQLDLYDELGEEGRIGIKVELAAGETIDLDAIIAAHPDIAELLEEFELSTDGFVGLPADGKMPAHDLDLVAEYAVEPFTITWVVDGVSITDTVKYGGLPTFPGGTPVKAPTAQYSYTFSGWDTEVVEAYGDATYTAQFDATVNEYTVTWNVDGNETTQVLPYGETPVFIGSTDKAATAQYTYTFKGWDKEVVAVTGDVTYTAQYDATVNEYTVTWDVDGNKTTAQVPYGTIPTYDGVPTKAPDAQYTYTFKGWDKEVVAVTGDVTYTAMFDNTPNTVSIIFKVDGQADVTVVVKIGETPVYPNGTPFKAADAQYTYTYKGWDKAITAATESTVYTAVFEGTIRKYTVTFKYGHNTILPVIVTYGQAAQAPTKTDKAPTASTIFTFDGWDVDFSNITGNLIVTAKYTETPRTYTVTFNYGDGKSETVTVEYGKAATAPTDTAKAATASTVYTFAGWDADFSSITGDLTVTAKYTETPTTFTVTFNYGDGKSETVTVEYGKPATAPTDTDKAATETVAYIFKGWDVDFSAVTADLTVNAVYEEAPIETPTVDTSALQAAIDAYKAAGLDVSAEALTKAEAALNDGTLTQEDIDALTAALQDAINSVESDTTEPDTAEPDTTEPDTTEPDTAEPDTAEPTEESTDEGSDGITEAPTESDTTVSGSTGCGDTWIWIVLVIVVAGAGAAAAIIFLRHKGIFGDHEPETNAPAEEPEAPSAAAPLFIPLGEEIPEEEISDEVETVETVDATDVDDMMSDKAAEHFLVVSDEEGGVGKMGIINVGVISAAYQAGDTVDLASLQEKGMIDVNIGRIKVLASGTLDKPLIIKADAFSVQAVKMITLTGGQAIELKGE